MFHQKNFTAYVKLENTSLSSIKKLFRQRIKQRGKRKQQPEIPRAGKPTGTKAKPSVYY